MQKIFGWGVSGVLQKVLVILFCYGVFSIHAVFAKKILPVNDISKKVERSRGSVEDIYYELLKNHFFDDVNNPESLYANNLILSTNLDEDPVVKGTILLNLIAWLEKKNNRDSRFLLHKINRLYRLEFHRTLSLLNPKYESYQDSLLSSFHDLSTYKTFHPAYGALYPFETSITKAVLTLFIINKTAIPFEQKRESVLYTIEKIKQEMIFINNNLGKEKIDEGQIRSFVFGLEKFGVRETLVESKLFRNLLLFSTAAIVIGFVVYRWDIVGTGLNSLGTKLKELIDLAFDGFFEKAGKGLVKGMLEDETVVQLTEQVNTQVEQAKAEYNEIKERYLNDLEGLAEKASEAAIRGILRAAAHPPAVVADQENNADENNPGDGAQAQAANGPNPDIQIIMQQVLAPLLGNEARDLGGHVENVLRGVLRAVAHPQVPAAVVAADAPADQPLVQDPAQVINPDVAAIRDQLYEPLLKKLDDVVREGRKGSGLVGSLLLGDGQERSWYNPARLLYGSAAPANSPAQDQPLQNQDDQLPAPTRSWYNPRGWFSGNKPNPQPANRDDRGDESDSDSDGDE